MVSAMPKVQVNHNGVCPRCASGKKATMDIIDLSQKTSNIL